MGDGLFDKIFEFKFMAKQMEKEASRAKKEQDKNTQLIKKALQKNDSVSAKQYAEKAIAAKGQFNRMTALSTKVNTIATKLTSAMKNHQLASQMGTLVQKLGAINLNQVDAMTNLENFEKMFDNLEVNATMMDQVFDNINAGTINDQEVNDLLQQCAEGQANKIDEMLNGPNQDQIGIKQNAGYQSNMNMIGNNYYP